MKKLTAILMILIVIPIEIHACDCGINSLSKLQKMEIENSECVFIGEVIKVNDDLTYQIKVVESLDGGDEKGNIYIGLNPKTCEPYVEHNGKWIVYAKMEGGFLKMNMCGISRSFDNPIIISSPTIVPSEKKNGLEKLRAENLKTALTELKLEIMALRKRRDGK